MKYREIRILNLIAALVVLSCLRSMAQTDDILTPKESPMPRINSAKVFGVRPKAPFLFTVAATGDRPMTFSADGLPAGLQLDPPTGQITGHLDAGATYDVTLKATNARGTAQGKFKIVCGPNIGLTPAMGWNSWNCFASEVSAEKVKSAADVMVSKGLINHGWVYVNIDDYWQVNPGRGKTDPTLAGPKRDPEGRILPNPRFPDMKGLTDYVHAKGLKIGIYSSPGPWTCGGCVGSWQHEDSDAQQYGDWGFDYLKYDWCSYSSVAKGDHSLPMLKKPYEVMRASLDKVSRDILFSFCQYGWGNVWEWGAETGGNSWRTTGDITDTWKSMSGIASRQAGLGKYAGPGHFNDPDMLIVGKVGWGKNLHPTRLTHAEQYTHVSLWCLLSAPLLIGCDMTQLDDFTLGLLTNDEVIAIDQDPLGHQADRVSQQGPLQVWAKDLEDGTKAVGLLNVGESDTPVTVKWSDLGLTGKQTVRDLWRQKDLGVFDGEFSAPVDRHGVVLVKITPSP
jgi:alpha-galactosidase